MIAALNRNHECSANHRRNVVRTRDCLSLLLGVHCGEGAGARRLATRAVKHYVRRSQLLSDEQVGAVRPPLRGDLRRWAINWTSAGGAIWLFAGASVAGYRRLSRRRRA